MNILPLIFRELWPSFSGNHGNPGSVTGRFQSLLSTNKSTGKIHFMSSIPENHEDFRVV